jgi:hypothetical protein
LGGFGFSPKKTKKSDFRLKRQKKVIGSGFWESF